ncbi:MAG: septal ring lytic transglycosylase RlpA family protein [Bacteroidota bacterium]
MKRHFLIIALSLFCSLTLYGQTQTGKASYYADKFEGRATASGEKYKHSKPTAAHRTLPFGTKVKVTNLANNKSVVVKINDRGPYVDGRVIDLSKSAAETLGFVNDGLAEVKIEVVDAGDGKGNSMPKAVDPSTFVDEKEFYDFNVERTKPNGFGVQIGSYRELVNLVRLSDNLKSSYRKEVTVQVKLVNNTKVYTLILGQFSTRAKADQFKAKLQKKYPDAFIIDYAKL